jgi:tRNA(Leu) C34 or U34 (ribose-2'-O)-methylase TrmL
MKNQHRRNMGKIDSQSKKSSGTYVGLTNPKNPTNVGSVMRAAGNYDVEQVFYTGTRYDKAAQYAGKLNNTDTQNVSKKIALTNVENLSELPSKLGNMPVSTKVICVDLVEGAIPLPHFEHPESAIYIFGPEDSTVPQEVIDKADAVVYVPTKGCMNLAASVNVLLYDRLAKSLILKNKIETDNALIRNSRDKNNRTIVN